MPDSIGMSSSTRKAFIRPATRSPRRSATSCLPKTERRWSRGRPAPARPAAGCPPCETRAVRCLSHAGRQPRVHELLPASPQRHTQTSPVKSPRAEPDRESSVVLLSSSAIRSSSSITLEPDHPRPDQITGQLTKGLVGVVGEDRDKGSRRCEAASEQRNQKILPLRYCAGEALGACGHPPASPNGPATLPATSNEPCNRCCPRMMSVPRPPYWWRW